MAFNIEQIKELVTVAKLLKPVISESADELLAAYGPEIDKVISRINLGIVDQTHISISKYISLGYTKEEAITLTLNTKIAIQEVLKNAKK